MVFDGKQEKDTVAMVAKTFFFSLKNSMSDQRKKIMLTTFVEKINYIYNFLQLYQVLFIYLSILMCKDDLQQAY